MRRSGKLLVFLALVAGPALAAPAGPASALAPSAYQQVLRVYEVNGAIAPCRFSASELQRALGGVDTYGAQYFADFTNAIQTALTARAAGACGPAAVRPSATASGAASDTVAPLPSVNAPTSAGVPAPLIVLAALAVGGVIAGGAMAMSAAERRGTAHDDDDGQAVTGTARL